jgi:hypothetical protein
MTERDGAKGHDAGFHSSPPPRQSTGHERLRVDVESVRTSRSRSRVAVASEYGSLP